MPNHTQNVIIFNNVTPEKQDEILNAITTISKGEPRVDFRTLIPIPLHIYAQSYSSIDEDDFGKKIVGNEWAIENWGTKWNAYQTEIFYNYEENKLKVKFQTAWSTPYPFIIAIANKFSVPFEFYSLCEGWLFGAREEWGFDDFLGEFRRKKSEKFQRSEMKEENKNFIDFWEFVHDAEYEYEENENEQ